MTIISTVSSALFFIIVYMATKKETSKRVYLFPVTVSILLVGNNIMQNPTPLTPTMMAVGFTAVLLLSAQLSAILYFVKRQTRKA